MLTTTWLLNLFQRPASATDPRENSAFGGGVAAAATPVNRLHDSAYPENGADMARKRVF